MTAFNIQIDGRHLLFASIQTENPRNLFSSPIHLAICRDGRFLGHKAKRIDSIAYAEVWSQ